MADPKNPKIPPTEPQHRGGMTVQEAGRKGGETVLHQRGPEFFAEIGRKGGQKVRELINAGKKGAETRNEPEK